MQAAKLAARDRKPVGPTAAEEVVLDSTIHDDRDSPVSARVNAAEHDAAFHVRDLPDIAAIRVDDEEVPATLTVALEHDRASVGEPLAAELHAGMACEPHGLAACDRRDPDVAAPRERDLRSIRAHRRRPRQIDVARRARGGHKAQRECTGPHGATADWDWHVQEGSRCRHRGTIR